MPELIAVIGMACRFPGGVGDAGSLWRLLSRGQDAIGTVPSDRWNIDRFSHPSPEEPGRAPVWAAGVLEGNPLRFDAAFFGISPREASLMDPQQRLVLELAWEAIEDAGILPSTLRGGMTGVAVGVASHGWGDRMVTDLGAGDSTYVSGVSSGIIANRVSHLFDLHGPSTVIDTACSSSLAAIDAACRWLETGEASLVLAGGVNLLLAPYLFIGLSSAGMLSPTGRCHSFDARADGYVRGEGGGLFVLEPLAAARKNGHRILGVIRASGIASDGWTPGLAHPSAAAQAQLIRRVWELAGAGPDDAAYIEAHGTGTAVGDSVEAEALGVSLGRRRNEALRIGSIKTNIGHLEAAAGAAGMAKVLEILRRGLIPPSLNFERQAPGVAKVRANVKVVTGIEPLSGGGTVPLVGLSSFGFGGTNAHLVLEPGPPIPGTESIRDGGKVSLFLSARSDEALDRRAAGIAAVLDEPLKDAKAVASTLAHYRQHLERRVAAVDIVPEAAALALRKGIGPVVRGRVLDRRGVAFVFCGNGSQWEGMGRRLFVESPVFRRTIEEVDRLLGDLGGTPLRQCFETPPSPGSMEEEEVFQPALFALQVGLVRLLEESGLRPEAVVGHSFGEVAAAWSAGVLTLADAVAVVHHRSRAQIPTRGGGRMAAVALTWEEVEARAGSMGLDIEIAARNTQRAVTVSGPQDDVVRLVESLRESGERATVLDLDYAFHSSSMDRCRRPILSGLSAISPQKARMALISTVTGGRVEGPEMDAEHWWGNIRRPVLFESAIRSLVDAGIGIAVEVGGRPVLGGYLREILAGEGGEVAILAAHSPEQSDASSVRRTAAAVWAFGGKVDLQSCVPRAAAPVAVPTYPWSGEVLNRPPSPEALIDLCAGAENPLLGVARERGGLAWERTFDRRADPWLADHRVGDRIILPGAALLEMVIAAAAPSAGTVVVEDLQLPAPVVVEEDRGIFVRTTLAEDTGRFRVESRRRFDERPWTLNALGWAVSDPEERPDWRQSIRQLESRAETVADGEGHYRLMESVGLNYGSAFRTVDSVGVAGDRALVGVVGGSPESRSLLDPGLLDGCLQGAVWILPEGVRRGGPLVPVRFRRVRFFPGGGLPSRAIVELLSSSEYSAAVSVRVVDGRDRPILEIGSLRLERMRRAAAGREGPPLMVEILEHAPLPGSVELALEDARAAVGQVLDAWGEPSNDRFLDLLSLFVRLRAREICGRLRLAGEAGQDQTAVAAPLWEGLVSAGYARRCEAGVELVESSEDLPEALSLWRTLFWRYPGRVGTVSLALEAMECWERWTLKEGMVAPESLEAADVGDAERTVEGTGEIGALAESLAAAVRAVCESGPPRPLRVLELAAGHGIMTRPLLHLAQSREIRLEVEGADALLEGEIRKWPWTVRTVSETQALGLYDVVVAGPRAVGELGAEGVLRSASPHLAPGGVLLTGALAAVWPWGVVLRGALAWAGIDPGQWRRLAGAHGFEAVRDVGDPCSGPLVLLLRKEEGRKDRDQEIGTEGANFRAARVMSIAGGDSRSRALRRALESLPERKNGRGSIRNGLPVVLVASSDQEENASDAVVEAVTALGTALKREVPPGTPLALVIPNGRSAPGDAAEGRMVGEALWAAARVLIHERPVDGIRMIDAAGWPDAERWAEAVVEELRIGGDEPEVVLRPGARRIPRLVPKHRAATVVSEGEEAVRLVTSESGEDRFEWIRSRRKPPGAGEVEVRVEAVGLNFRDLMLSLGMLPGEAIEVGKAGSEPGMECAGRIVGIGDGVVDMRLGDQVLVLGGGVISRFLTVDADWVRALPEGLEPEAAAGTAAVTLTVRYALDVVARLEGGQWLLIHGGAGGVGMAAIQHAVTLGARVIATAGSPARRGLLRALGVEHVFDSRSGAFEEGVLRVTEGRGVDVVLNSLAGSLLERSLGLLAPFGHFIELGKRDVFADRSVGLYALRHNGRLSVVDVDSLMKDRPKVAKRLLKEIGRDLETGVVRPPPYRVFPADRLVEAFDLMRRGGHVGKIVLSTRKSIMVVDGPAPDPIEAIVRTDRSCLITGGLGGLGLAIAARLAERGVKTLILAGRSGAASPSVRERIESQAFAQCRVEVVTLDVTDEVAVRTLMDRFGRDLEPLGGIIHAAAVFEDRTISGIEAESVRRVVEPKVQGALLLDRLARETGAELQFFVVLSSAVTLVGNHGQAAYAAANAAMEAVVVGRQMRGEPGLAVALGPVIGGGMLSRAPDLVPALERKLGGRFLEVSDVVLILEQLLSMGVSSPVGAPAAELSWSTFAAGLPRTVRRRMTLLSKVGAARGAGDELGFAEMMELEPGEALEKMMGLLRRLVARVLRVDPERVELGRPLAEQGMDSLMAAELQGEIEEVSVGIGGIPPLSGALSVKTLASEMLRAGRTAVATGNHVDEALDARHGEVLDGDGDD